jgi:hypothetical protein
MEWIGLTDSTMSLFADLLLAANDDAIGFDALLRECSVEVCESSRTRQGLRIARIRLDRYVQNR